MWQPAESHRAQALTSDLSQGPPQLLQGTCHPGLLLLGVGAIYCHSGGQDPKPCPIGGPGPRRVQSDARTEGRGGLWLSPCLCLGAAILGSVSLPGGPARCWWRGDAAVPGDGERTRASGRRGHGECAVARGGGGERRGGARCGLAASRRPCWTPGLWLREPGVRPSGCGGGSGQLGTGCLFAPDHACEDLVDHQGRI